VHSQELATRLRQRTLLLVLSSGCNVLLFTLCALILWEHSWRNEARSVAVIEVAPSLSETVEQLRQQQWEQQVAALFTAKVVEYGFTVRDLALACLVHDYGLDIERIWGGLPRQRRMLRTSRGPLILYQGITDGDWHTLYATIKHEKYPLNPDGCIRWLCRTPEKLQHDQRELLTVLFRHEEWQRLEVLFQGGLPRSRDQLLLLAQECGWPALRPYLLAESQESERRRNLLASALEQGSRLAMRWLIEEDSGWAVRKLSDAQLLRVMSTVLPNVGSTRAFLTEILLGPRNDGVRLCAAQKLYALEGEVPPSSDALDLALRRFAPSIATNHIARKVSNSLDAQGIDGEKRVVTVAPGDSLWKIAQQHNCTVEELLILNQLDSANIRPGRVLQLP